MTRSPTHNVGPAPRSGGSPRWQARLHARRGESEASSALGGRRASASGNCLCRFVPLLLAALVLARVQRTRHRRPASTMRRLADADELRFVSLCQQITLPRQGAET